MKLTLKNIWVVAISFTLLASGCESFLDVREPDAIPGEQVLQSEQNVERVLLSAYNQFAGGRNNFVRVSTLYGDEVNMERLNQDQFGADFITRQFGIFNGNGEGLWSNGYTTIFAANAILNALDNNTFNAPADVKERMRGEAHFLRGFMHFELVRHFALPYSAGENNLGVIIQDQFIFDANQMKPKPRNTVKECYDFAIAELEKAIQFLPEAAQLNRFDKNTARAILARVHFNRANADGYQKAADLANTVMAAPRLKLTQPLAAFRKALNVEADSSVIFQIVNTPTDDFGGGLSGNFWGFNGDQVFLPYDMRAGGIFDQLKNRGGLRFTFLVANRTGERPYTNKYPGGSGVNSRNTPVVRLQEMMLTRAEALLETGGNPIEARTLLNKIRKLNTVDTTDVTSTAELLNFIRIERGVEMALEGDRFHELRRLKSENIRGIRFDDPKGLLKIPNSEVRANPLIVQN